VPDMKRLHIHLMAVVLGLGAMNVIAADFDGSKPLICSAIEANDCALGVGCEKGLAEDVNVPQFIRLDFSNKVMGAVGRTSKMLNQTRAGGMLTIQGIEGSRAFSITISESNGKLVGAIAGDQEAFVIFGACTPL
jgi:hypothetical protein